jgi:hypothetical protein
MEKFSVGLADATLTPEGDVLVSYYAGPTPDDTCIHWARLSMV